MIIKFLSILILFKCHVIYRLGCAASIVVYHVKAFILFQLVCVVRFYKMCLRPAPSTWLAPVRGSKHNAVSYESQSDLGSDWPRPASRLYVKTLHVRVL